MRSMVVVPRYIINSNILSDDGWNDERNMISAAPVLPSARTSSTPSARSRPHTLIACGTHPNRLHMAIRKLFATTTFKKLKYWVTCAHPAQPGVQY